MDFFFFSTISMHKHSIPFPYEVLEDGNHPFYVFSVQLSFKCYVQTVRT